MTIHVSGFQPNFFGEHKLWTTLHVVKWLGCHQQYLYNFTIQINLKKGPMTDKHYLKLQNEFANSTSSASVS